MYISYHTFSHQACVEHLLCDGCCDSNKDPMSRTGFPPCHSTSYKKINIKSTIFHLIRYITLYRCLPVCVKGKKGPHFLPENFLSENVVNVESPSFSLIPSGYSTTIPADVYFASGYHRVSTAFLGTY